MNRYRCSHSFHHLSGKQPFGEFPALCTASVAVVTDNTDQSNVLRGENGGRLLQHVSVARSLARVATVSSAAQMSVHIPFPHGFHLDSGTGHHLILFAQE